MPIFNFSFEPRSAGCVERATVMTPWGQPQRHPQTGQAMSPPDAAWYWLQTYANQKDQNGNCALYFPPNCQVGCQAVGGGGEGQPAQVLAVQVCNPSADRQQVNAPYNQPIGNGRNLTLPPEQQKQRVVPQGLYEDLTDCALASNSDSLMGEMDGEAGTFTDYSPNDRTETVRQYAMPPSQKVTDRR